MDNKTKAEKLKAWRAQRAKKDPNYWSSCYQVFKKNNPETLAASKKASRAIHRRRMETDPEYNERMRIYWQGKHQERMAEQRAAEERQLKAAIASAKRLEALAIVRARQANFGIHFQEAA